MCFLLQVQRLAEPQPPTQKQQSRRKQAAAVWNGEPLSGLGYAYPACPMCSKKMIRAQEAQWACKACKASVTDVRWTYRLGVHLLTGTNSAVAASILGSVADAWFGCSAAQWVRMVEQDVALIVRLASTLALGERLDESSVAGKLASDTAALVDGVSGICASYALFEFRTPSFPPQPQAWKGDARATMSPTVSRIVCERSEDARWIPVSALWKYVVFEALCAMHRRCGGSSEPDQAPSLAELEGALRELRTNAAVSEIACALYPPPSLTALSCVSSASEAKALVADSKGIVDLSSSRTWESVQLSALFGLQAADVEEADEMDGLLDHCSQLFQSFTTSTNRQNITGEAMSMQLFEESMHDDQLHSMFTEYSQQQQQSQTPLGLSMSTAALLGTDMEGFASGSQYSTPPATFLRALEATPETMARDIRNHSVAEEHQGPSSQIEVLAPETPATIGATSGSDKRRRFEDPSSPMDASMSPSRLLRGLGDVVPATDLVSRYRRLTDRATPSKPPRSSKSRHHSLRRLTERSFSALGPGAHMQIPEPLPLKELPKNPNPLAAARLVAGNNEREAVRSVVASPVVVLAPETPVARPVILRPLVLVKSNSDARNSYSDSG